MSALCEGTLGTLPAGYGNNGHMPVDASVTWAFLVLPTQPHSQNDVNNPVVADQPPHSDRTPPSGGGIGVADDQGGGIGCNTFRNPTCSGFGVVAAVLGSDARTAAALAPPGSRAAKDRAQVANAVLQRQLAAGAAPNSEPTVFSTGDEAQIHCGHAPDLNGLL